MERDSLNLSLVENSHTFMVEAARKAISAREDIRQWPFAILNLVQSVELSLKELLRREHPILIFKNIDEPHNTVSLSQALARIENPKILGITIPEDEKHKIAKAVKLRNKITHFEFELTAEYAMAKFSELFAFLFYFQGRFLKVEVDEILPQDLLQSVREIEKFRTDMRDKAVQRIKDENVSQDLVWPCPDCGEETFVIEDDQNVCFFCRATAEVVECPHCGQLCFGHEMQDFSDLIDSDDDSIHNDYGYSCFEACPECIENIQEDIEQQKSDKYYHFLEERGWYSRRQ